MHKPPEKQNSFLTENQMSTNKIESSDESSDYDIPPNNINCLVFTRNQQGTMETGRNYSSSDIDISSDNTNCLVFPKKIQKLWE